MSDEHDADDPVFGATLSLGRSSPRPVAVQAATVVARPAPTLSLGRSTPRPVTQTISASSGITALVKPSATTKGKPIAQASEPEAMPLATRPAAPIPDTYAEPASPIAKASIPAAQAMPYREPTPAPSGGGGGGGGGGSAQQEPAPQYQEEAPWAPPEKAASTAITRATSTALVTGATQTTNTKIEKKSLWARFWAFLGFGSKTATAHGDFGASENPRSLPQVAASLVRRARAGDQNAMAIIELVGKNAKAGQPKAKASGAAIMAYIQAHPVANDATMGLDSPTDATFCEAIKLASGPTLYDARIRTFADTQFQGEDRQAFAYGVRSPHEPAPEGLSATLARAHRMGRTVGLARKLQAVRMPNTPLSHYDARVGYELGEETDYGAEMDRVSLWGSSMLKRSYFLASAMCVWLMPLACVAPAETNGDDAMTRSDEGVGADGLPKRQNGWSANGTLNPTFKSRRVGLQAEFEEPGTYTLTFSLARTPPLVPFTIFCQALIEWSIAGNTITRKVSVANGTSISGVAQAVRAVLTDETTQAINQDYNVAITVTKGIRGASTTPPTLQPPYSASGVAPRIQLAAGATADFTIPTDCGASSVHVSVGVGAAPFAPLPEQIVQVLHLSDAAAQYQKRYDPRAAVWEPLAESATIIRLQNHSAVTVDFGIIFGIDG